MALRRRRLSVRRSGTPPVPARRGRGLYSVDVALDARLLGRFRLLTIEAGIDVSEPVREPGSVGSTGARAARPILTSRPVIVPPARHRSNGGDRHRRVDAEVLLGDAERSLGATPVPPRT